MGKAILRGEMYYADLSPVLGSEQGGVRPVLIIQNNIGNKHSPTTIVAAITSKAITKTSLPTHHLLNSSSKLDKESIVLLEQIRTIDKRRLKDYVGFLDQRDMKKIDVALALSVGLV
ncbi:MAG TPA: type II toxin-antitoxin system PemK/MazF family toxin [Clostridiales bacterium]|nr:type II toxin-antitoxin system PemK/MazF family toxin [Clostridiales bacterium]